MENAHMFRNILVAVDGSADSERALRRAAVIAHSGHGKLTLITVNHAPWSAGVIGPPIGTYSSDQQAWAQAMLDELAATLPEGIETDTVVAWGPVIGAILKQIDEGGHDLVVVGSRGRGGVASTVLGSVSRAVLDHSSIPVLVERPGPASEASHSPRIERFASILVAVDRSDESLRALDVAVDLAQCHKAGLTLVTVAMVPYTAGIAAASLSRIYPDFDEESRTILDEALARVPAGIHTRTVSAWGATAQVILDVAISGGQDLIVLGSRGRGTLGSALLGSTGHAVLNHSTVPVLVVRPRAKAAAIHSKPTEHAATA